MEIETRLHSVCPNLLKYYMRHYFGPFGISVSDIIILQMIWILFLSDIHISDTALQFLRLAADHIFEAHTHRWQGKYRFTSFIINQKTTEINKNTYYLIYAYDLMFLFFFF